MNKKIITTIIIFIVLLIAITSVIFLYNTNKTNKYYCEIDEDCIMSYSDKENFQICVNNNWYKLNPSTIEYQCKKNTELYCLCQNNKCTRNDKELGC